MKIKINRNILWTETFANELFNYGVKYACISPGSRNTPLTLAFAGHPGIKSYLIIDERSCGFFGLGLAKASNTPVVLISTSGTATAEFYPAIIEAYQQRVPLIVCTADRSPELLNCGANQTINQDNLYKNHILWFFNVGLPEPIPSRLTHIKSIARRSVIESLFNSKGPVHLNFPFRKPFEPYIFTDEIDEEIINGKLTKRKQLKQLNAKIIFPKEFSDILSLILSRKKGVIIAGPENEKEFFSESCQQLAELLKIPILADGASQLRFGKHDKSNFISNFEGFVRSGSYSKLLSPDYVLHFGKTVTSKGLEIFLENTSAERYMINEYGDWHDPSNKSIASLALRPDLFCSYLIDQLNKLEFKNIDESWLNLFLTAQEVSDKFKTGMIANADFPFEGRIINEVISLMPDDSCLMISNSMPVRDLDYFAPKTDKSIIVYNNRGASGIDGITSTALGIAEASHKPTVLITGDLAFYYDLNGLLTSKKYFLPLIVILINNNGGGIFEMLPIASYEKYFREYFIAPHDLDFSHFVKGYGGNFFEIKDWDDLNNTFNRALTLGEFSVLQINTDAKISAEIRQNYWLKIDEVLMASSLYSER